jgi:hypothetical protein
VLASVLAATVLSGCAERERLNPLDPENTTTGGLIAGFGARAGNGQVEVVWQRLPQSDVASYRLQRWIPGQLPAYLPEVYGSTIAGTVDSLLPNGETFLYRLVARFTSGDSAVSPVDTATTGTRRIAVLSAGAPGYVGLTPDARDVLFTLPSDEAPEDMEVDRTRDVIWLTLPGEGVVFRQYFDGTLAGPTLVLNRPTDVSVSNQRGIAWIALPDLAEVRAYGPDLSATTPFDRVSGTGDAHVVEAGTTDLTVWIGDESGVVYRYVPETGPVLGTWDLGDRVIYIALDEAMDAAWVATRGASGDKLFRIDGADSSVTALPGVWGNIADIEFDPVFRSLWISERGPPGAGLGRLTRASASGATQATLSGVEPFGITTDPLTGHCWASELKSNRVIEVASSGSIVRWSISVSVPYAVRVLGGP